MVKRTIIWSDQAQSDRIEILHYWIHRNKSKEYSVKLNKLIMRAIELLYLMILVLGKINAQTYINGFIGIDLSNAREPENIWGYEVLNKGYSCNSILLGVGLDRRLSNYINIGFQISRTKKYVKAKDHGSTPLIELEFIKYTSSVLFSYEPFNNLRIGCGPLIYYIPKIIGKNSFGRKDELRYSETIFGIKLNSSYLYRQFIIGISFEKCIIKETANNFAKSINAFQFTLGYNYKI